MNLTQAQLAQVLIETDRVSQISDSVIDPEQVRQILHDLNLPNELLEDAIAQVQQYQLQSQQKQRHRIVLFTIAIMIAGLIATIAVVYQKQQNRIARIAALQDTVTRQDSTQPVNQFDRQKDSQVSYRVTLKDAMVNERLRISCRWSDPSGQTAYQSRYQTEKISRSPWETVCNAPLTPQSQTGTWSVKMFVEERPISDQTFVVK